MSVQANVRELWRRVSAMAAGGEAAALPRQTQTLPLMLNTYHAGQALLPKPTPANLRRFAETPVVRRAINLIKDRIAAMDWQVQRAARIHAVPTDADARARWRRCGGRWRSRTSRTRFRTLIEQALEDALVGGFGAIEMEPTGDPERPLALWAVDGATIRINAKWDGEPDIAALCAGRIGCRAGGAQIPLRRRRADVYPDESALASRRLDWGRWRLRSRR